VSDAIQTGDRILLRAADGKIHFLDATDGTARVPGLGVLKIDQLLGKTWGSTLRIGGEEFRILRPNLADHIENVERGAQIITAKDASRILLECGLRAGSRIVEAGVGSGALTIVLANAVAPNGRVHAYDIRDDHLKNGQRNVKAAGLASVCDFQVGDVTKSIPHTELDAIILDLPEPELCVDHAFHALAHSGVLACYSPMVSQVERSVRAMRTAGFIDVRSLELLERAWKVGERGSRPETNMLAHTGFLTFARKP
jgi:tRNA (adenine57-N1/adenine58-N1)-methyltransferase catalytic subunit